MVAEKDGAMQLDHATWETLRGLVRLEVTSSAHLWSDTLEKSRALMDCRLDEFHGTMSTVDSEHSATLAQLNDRQAYTETKLAGLEVELHQAAATARGDIRRASVELDDKIKKMGEKDDSKTQALEDHIDRESASIREQHRLSTTEILATAQNLQQQVIEDRAERQATQTRCMHHTDRQVAAAMASKELEARFQAVRDSTTELERKLDRVADAVRVDLAQYAQELCASLSSRSDDMSALADRRHAEMNTQMGVCSDNAREAASEARKAVRLVDESLHEKVHTASRNLMEQIEAAAVRSAGAGQASEFAAEQHIAKRAQELQAGFYSLVAREALDTEIRALVDRATQRLQVVANDLAQRSATIQEHVVGAEERLVLACEFAQRQAEDLEAQKSETEAADRPNLYAQATLT